MNKLFIYLIALTAIFTACDKKDPNKPAEKLTVNLPTCKFECLDNWTFTKDTNTGKNEFDLHKLVSNTDPNATIELYLFKDKLMTEQSKLIELTNNDKLKAYDPTTFVKWENYDGQGLTQESPYADRKDKYVTFIGSNATKSFAVRIHYPKGKGNEGIDLFKDSFTLK